ncbi:MAG TPA: glycoside hydrolase family 76 protein [Verrucomicrobiae bacterium]|nr:glycoside hydrolase family 76 protein [Verrucomicrobiae bacterium]
MNRVRRVVCALAFAAFATLGQTPANYHQRADEALESFLLKFWDGPNQYLRHRYPSDGALTGYWTFANGWAALVDGVERSGKSQYYGLIDTFYDGQNQRGWGSDYYDDLCWMIDSLLRSYDLTGDSKYLNQAKSIFANVQAAWDVSCCGSVRGGVWWDKAHTQKATASNAGAALAAARLYRRTGAAAYLTFARQVFSFWSTQMVDSSTGQVCDHINPSGEKVWWKFTYNEGLMIGAALELYEATGESTFLTQAHRYAGFMVANEVTATAHGNVLSDGSNATCTGDCAQFKGPAYRYLARLHARSPRTAYANVLRASEEGIWNLARDASGNTFATCWAGPPETAVEMMEQNAAATALSRFAQQSGPYATTIRTNVFEAENAVIHNIPLEALYAGYHGWGYLAGWNADGQSVDFRISFATAGTHTLTFSYSAGAGNASRNVVINGVEAFTNLTFPGTGAWSSYNTVSMTRTLPAGTSVITVRFDSARGSANWLNLDYLQIPNYTPPPPGPIAAKLGYPFVTLTWNSPGFLQAAPSITGPWTDWTNSPPSPANLTIPSTAQFFRIRQ